MTFAEAMATQPAWVRLWVLWMSIVITLSVIVLLFSKAARRDALFIFLANAGAFITIQWLYQKLGYVRLLGLAHIVFWTPLAVYLVWRLRDPDITTPYRQVLWVLLATMGVSLAFDYTDAVRYALGERAPLVP